MFHLILNTIIQKTDAQKSIFNQSIQICAYADDIVFIARDKNTLEEEFIKRELEAPDVGPIINYEKTKYTRASNIRYMITS